MFGTFKPETLVIFSNDVLSSLLASKEVCKEKHVRLLSVESNKEPSAQSILDSVGRLLTLYGNTKVQYCGNYCVDFFLRKLFNIVYNIPLKDLAVRYPKLSVYEIARCCEEISRIAIAIAFAGANNISCISLPYTKSMLQFIGGYFVFADIRSKAYSLGSSLSYIEDTDYSEEILLEESSCYLLSNSKNNLLTRLPLGEENDNIDSLTSFWSCELKDTVFCNIDTLYNIFQHIDINQGGN